MLVSAQQALLKYPHVVRRWPRLTCLQVSLCVGGGNKGQL